MRKKGQEPIVLENLTIVAKLLFLLNAAFARKSVISFFSHYKVRVIVREKAPGNNFMRCEFEETPRMNDGEEIPDRHVYTYKKDVASMTMSRKFHD